MNLYWIILLTALALVLYVLKIARLNYHWVSYPAFKPDLSKPQTGISVVIAFRNEYENLQVLLPVLESQFYPVNLHEVILVDDYSDDESDIIVRHFCDNHPNFKYISNQGNRTGKKSAIKTGIKHASFELIAVTDADCIMNENWLSLINQFYTETRADMIIGLVDMITEKGFFNRFQEVEFLSLIAAGAGASAGNRPIYCNAANLIFKKSLFFELNDPLKEGIQSGDDTFFLHMAKRKSAKIFLLKSTGTIVTTYGQTSFKNYMNQRLRWVSKSRYYRDTDTIYTAVLVFFTNLMWLISFLLLLLKMNFLLFPLVFIIKTSTDFFFLRNFMKFYSKRLHLSVFVLYAIIYPFMVTVSAVAGLCGIYSWKGRNFKPVKP